ncbi:MAG: 3-dehydroquinate synthase [Alphaproteobacteria bacterium]|nr:3-dehydroquinate synthase [Alphaproteobacteria bacterium]
MTQTLSLDLGERSYDIHIGKCLIDTVADLVPLDLKGSNVFILYDQNVYPYVQVMEEALANAGAETKIHAEKGGEPTKSYDGYFKVMNWLLENGVNRQSVLIAVGGGVIGDLGGFAAATVMRGVHYVQVPTTLLAQVDSSVGGKTGINTAQGKNLVGAFYQPKAVLCDIGTLGTLPDRELKAGYAEIVKYGLINDLSFFEWLEENGEKVLSLDEEALTYAVHKSCAAKAAVVAADEREAGQRALLNLGHTFGHALEAAAGYDGSLLHGEAVSIGMVMAFDLSARMGLCSQEDPVRVEAHLKSCGLKTRVSDITPAIRQSAEELWDNMTRDKKAVGSKIGFILARGIGESFQSYDVDEAVVMSVLNDHLQQ